MIPSPTTRRNTPKSFNSTYDDRAAGTSVELSETLPGGIDTVRVAGHFRWDQHNETESTRNAPFAPFYSQRLGETAQETTSSLALENIYHPAAAWDIIAGGSYDYRHLIGDSQWVAAGVTPPFGYSYAYPVANKHAWNSEAAAVTGTATRARCTSATPTDRAFQRCSRCTARNSADPSIIPTCSRSGLITHRSASMIRSTVLTWWSMPFTRGWSTASSPYHCRRR